MKEFPYAFIDIAIHFLSFHCSFKGNGRLTEKGLFKLTELGIDTFQFNKASQSWKKGLP